MTYRSYCDDDDDDGNKLQLLHEYGSDYLFLFLLLADSRDRPLEPVRVDSIVVQNKDYVVSPGEPEVIPQKGGAGGSDGGFCTIN